MTSFRYNGVYQTERNFHMEYELKDYYRVYLTINKNYGIIIIQITKRS